METLQGQQTGGTSSTNAGGVEANMAAATAPKKQSPVKKNYCRYCGTLQTKLSRHLTKKHPELPEMATYMRITCADKREAKQTKRELMRFIMNEGNRVYNERVASGKVADGQFIAAKQSTTDIGPLTHVFCSACGGLFSRRNFSSHRPACELRQTLVKGSSADGVTRSPGSVLICPSLDSKFDTLKRNILDGMIKDEISLIAHTDALILEFGRRFLRSHVAVTQRNYVVSKIRTLAELVARMRKSDPNVKCMADCIDPCRFNALCDTVKIWSGYDESTGNCRISSIPRRICKSLKSCSHILWSEAIQERTAQDARAMAADRHERFSALMSNDWPAEINSAADKSLKTLKSLKRVKMPLLEDISKFLEVTSGEIARLTDELVDEDDEPLLRTTPPSSDLIESLIAYLIVFNGRRPSEVVQATVSEYRQLESREGGELSVFTTLASKNHVKVPILVPYVARKAIDSLLEGRARDAPTRSTPFLLCKQDGTTFNGSAVLNKRKLQVAGLKRAEDLTANGLRHFWATRSQLDSNLKRHMPKFLGHTLKTHQKFYEMPLSEIHLKVVGPAILQAVSPPKTRATLDVARSQPPAPACPTQPAATATTSECMQSAAQLTSSDNFVGGEQSCHAHTAAGEPQVTDVTPPPSIAQALGPEIRQSGPPGSSGRLPAASLGLRQQDSSSAVPGGGENTAETSTLDEEEEEENGASSGGEGRACASQISRKHKWTTAEQRELFHSLPRTILGMSKPGRGKVVEVWGGSKHIRRNHSLQTTRIEVSKYFTGKKQVSAAVKNELLKLI